MGQSLDDLGTVKVVAEKVEALLAGEGSGHDWEHVRRVWRLAERLARHEEANVEIVALTALLHDVDDRKVTGDLSSEEKLPAARRILAELDYSAQTIEIVCSNIRSMGYHKSLEGTTPATIEAKIVGDADYLEALGSIGIARCFTFGGSRGRPIFLPTVMPEVNHSKESYVNNLSHSTNHFFEKLLRLKQMMQTKAGAAEAAVRHGRMVTFLTDLFEEVSAPPEWSAMLEEYRGR